MLRKISYEASQCEGDGGEDAPEENAFDAHRCCFAVALLLLNMLLLFGSKCMNIYRLPYTAPRYHFRFQQRSFEDFVLHFF